MAKTKKEISVVVWKEDNLFVAQAVGLELASQGKTRAQAVKNLQEALDLLLEEDNEKIEISNLPKRVDLNRIYA